MNLKINTLFKNLQLKSLFKKSSFTAILLGLVICLLLVFLMDKYMAPSFVPYIENNENMNDNESGSKSLVFFYMNGCGHCDKFMPTWEEVKSEYSGAITLTEKESASATSDIEKFKIKGFPAILLVDSNNNKIKEYNGDRSKPDVMKFLKDNA
jgi:thiol-disulfide isomerase/thioredoxin